MTACRDYGVFRIQRFRGNPSAVIQAGTQLTHDDLQRIAGGFDFFPPSFTNPPDDTDMVETTLSGHAAPKPWRGPSPANYPRRRYGRVSHINARHNGKPPAVTIIGSTVFTMEGHLAN